MPTFKDYAGKKIGRVNVISLNLKTSGGTKWNCKCDCGKEFVCWSANFKRGSKFECQPCRNERRRGIDLTGKVYGRWSVLERIIDKRGKTQWRCQCDCGNFGIVSSRALGKQGKSQSCGCLARKMQSKHINTTLYPPAHGLSKTKFYAMKTTLIHKCYKEKHPSFHLFGEIGIRVCDLWRNGARDMYEWALENGWEEGDVFYLKDGEKEFNPENVLIIKEKEFHSIKALKGGHQITYKGETHSVRKWSEIMDICPASLRNRLKKYPSIDIAFESIFRKQKFVRNPDLKLKIVELYKGGIRIKAISKIVDVTPATIGYHLKNLGIEIKNDMKKPKRHDISTLEIIRLHKGGESMSSISRILGCSWPTVKFRIDKFYGKKRDRSNG